MTLDTAALTRQFGRDDVRLLTEVLENGPAFIETKRECIRTLAGWLCIRLRMQKDGPGHRRHRRTESRPGSIPTARAGSTSVAKRKVSPATTALSMRREWMRRWAPWCGIRLGIRALDPDAQPDHRSVRRRGSRRRHQLERSLLERGVLERALHLIAAAGVAAPVVEVLGDRVERDPLAARAVAGGVALPVPRPRKIASTCSIARSRLARARGPMSSSIVQR